MDNFEQIVQQTITYVKQTLAGEGSGHDWWHVYRVWKMALFIGQQEQVDLLVVQLAALLHDIADWKFYDGDEDIGPQTARRWLEQQAVPEAIIQHVTGIIRQMSFKGANIPTVMSTREGMVVQDADRLDAIGAIGITRTFAYGGSKGREIHNPEILPQQYETAEQYRNSTAPTINHFYEKLLLLKDLMNTTTAKTLAMERHHFMEQFLERFFAEWEGNL